VEHSPWRSALGGHRVDLLGRSLAGHARVTAAAGIGSFPLLTVLIYVADEHPAAYASVGRRRSREKAKQSGDRNMWLGPYTSVMADEDTVLEEAMDNLKEAGQRNQGDPEPHAL